MAAYAIWGVVPIYWPLLEPSGAMEILAHRMVWSLVVVGVLVGVGARRSGIPLTGRTGRFGFLYRRGVPALLTAAAATVTVNWGLYIWSVNNGHVVDASLGYFVNPLVSVVLGVALLRERLRPLQWVAVGVATLGVAELTVAGGTVPWIALVLAVSFGVYGLLKKLAAAPAVEALAVETGVLFLPALAWLVGLAATGRSTFGGLGLGHAALLASTGVVTALPLLFFGAAATRIPLSTLGVLQYLAPTLQFLAGVLVFDEHLSPARLVGFVVIWAALALFTADALRSRHSPRPPPAGA